MNVEVALALALGVAAGCAKPHVTKEDCARLLDRYATVVGVDKERVRAEAANDPAFASCPQEVTPAGYACAMGTADPDAFEACLAKR